MLLFYVVLLLSLLSPSLSLSPRTKLSLSFVIGVRAILHLVGKDDDEDEGL